MGVADVQRALRSIGYFPGGKSDGICGYRTQSAMRLFQEYVRSVEKLDCLPDGRFGQKSQVHLRRWLDNRLLPDWSPTIERWQTDTQRDTEYEGWLELLNQVKSRCLASPNRMLQMVDAFTKP
jgi:peptidoglycan hydrolase-like protein with peptidoglycan-binding domain